MNPMERRQSERRRLALVNEPTRVIDLGSQTDDAENFAQRLGEIEEILWEQFRASPSGEPSLPPSTNKSPEPKMPLCIRLTVESVLDVAQDADLRAGMLEWSAGQIPTSPQLLSKVSSLREAALDLRKTAALLMQGWSQP